MQIGMNWRRVELTCFYVLKLFITLFSDEGQQEVHIFDSVNEVRKSYERRGYVSVTVEAPLGEVRITPSRRIFRAITPSL